MFWLLKVLPKYKDTLHLNLIVLFSLMTETHEVVVAEDLEYIAQAERIKEEGPKTIPLKPSSDVQREISIKKEVKKPKTSSKGFLSNVRNSFKKPKK